MKSAGSSTGWAAGTYRPLQAVKSDAIAAFLYRYDKTLFLGRKARRIEGPERRQQRRSQVLQNPCCRGTLWPKPYSLIEGLPILPNDCPSPDCEARRAFRSWRGPSDRSSTKP
nr:hypothetical protein [uncultured Brachybacterium sp.]